ncbi:MAG: hypothetical protein ABSE81_02700 [Candidatus Omnitrophota bacterium]|jgi:chromosome segregation ATPase
MEQKIKFIIIGLIGFSVICLFLFLSTLNSKQLLIHERNDLKTKNTSLNANIDKLQDNLREYDKKMASLNKDMEQAVQEKSDLQAKYSEVAKSRDDLAAKLKELQARPAEVKQEPVEAPQTNDAYWASIIKAKTDLEFQINSLRDELKNIQISNESLSREKSALELELNNLKHEREDLKRQLDYNQKLTDSISQELVREKNDKSQIEDSFKTLKNENTVLTRQIRTLNSHRTELEKKIEQLQEGKAAVERRVNEMESILTDKMGQIDNLKTQIDAVRSGKPLDAPQGKGESVELPAIVVKPSSQVINQVNMQNTHLEERRTGKILAVNRDNNFVIIDLGQASGIKTGDKLKVYRADKNIGYLEVIQVRQDISACDIKKENAALKIGDIIR